jgi:hypothetical protein
MRFAKEAPFHRWQREMAAGMHECCQPPFL